MRPLPQTFSPRKTRLGSRKRGQSYAGLIKTCQPMSLSLCVRKWVLCSLVASLPAIGFSSPNFHASSGESAIAGPQVGSQDYPHLSIGPYGGYLVWQDNTAPQGLTINAMPLNS